MCMCLHSLSLSHFTFSCCCFCYFFFPRERKEESEEFHTFLSLYPSLSNFYTFSAFFPPTFPANLSVKVRPFPCFFSLLICSRPIPSLLLFGDKGASRNSSILLVLQFSLMPTCSKMFLKNFFIFLAKKKSDCSFPGSQ